MAGGTIGAPPFFCASSPTTTTSSSVASGTAPLLPLPLARVFLPSTPPPAPAAAAAAAGAALPPSDRGAFEFATPADTVWGVGVVGAAFHSARERSMKRDISSENGAVPADASSPALSPSPCELRRELSRARMRSSIFCTTCATFWATTSRTTASGPPPFSSLSDKAAMHEVSSIHRICTRSLPKSPTKSPVVKTCSNPEMCSRVPSSMTPSSPARFRQKSERMR